MKLATALFIRWNFFFLSATPVVMSHTDDISCERVGRSGYIYITSHE